MKSLRNIWYCLAINKRERTVVLARPTLLCWLNLSPPLAGGNCARSHIIGDKRSTEMEKKTVRVHEGS